MHSEQTYISMCTILSWSSVFGSSKRRRGIIGCRMVNMAVEESQHVLKKGSEMRDCGSWVQPEVLLNPSHFLPIDIGNGPA